MCSFYYVNWDDPIYDQFDDYMEKLEEEEEKAKHEQRSKGTVRLNYKVLENTAFGVMRLSPSKVPRRPSKQPPHGPQVEDIATKYGFLFSLVQWMAATSDASLFMRVIVGTVLIGKQN